MQVPSFKKLNEETQRKGPQGFFCEVSFLHPNPRFYKYYWWIFWRKSSCDGLEFLNKENRMPTKKAMDLIKKLKSEKESYWIYNRRLPRSDSTNPFNPDSEKWRNAEWAKSFDEDEDELFDGFK